MLGMDSFYSFVNLNMSSTECCDGCTSAFARREYAPKIITTTCVIDQGNGAIDHGMKPNCAVIHIYGCSLWKSLCAVSPTSQRKYI
jgi:hypothetical protein